MSAFLGLGAAPAELKKTSWKEYALRFAFGGAITASAGVIAHFFGPVVGGLFLAFPAILPASVTLVQRHEDRRAAGVDAFGAALGSIGLMVFGIAIWLLSPRLASALAILLATVFWFAASAALWALLRPRLRAADDAIGASAAGR